MRVICEKEGREGENEREGEGEGRRKMKKDLEREGVTN